MPSTDIVNISERDVEARIKDFTDLLRDIDNLDDKMRALWKQIYENAITERQNSYVCFTQLFNIVNNKSNEWAVHGKTLTSCVDRMSKANDQLIRLAELVAKAKHVDQQINPDDVFDQINARR